MQQEMSRRVCLAIALSLAFLSSAVARPTIENDTTIPPTQPRFRVVDGDTVKFGPQFVQLFGI